MHDDVIKWKHFPRYWPFVWGIHRPPVNSPHKGQWCRALMFSLICAWINSWVNNCEGGDLRHHHARYDVIVMERSLHMNELKKSPGFHKGPNENEYMTLASFNFYEILSEMCSWALTYDTSTLIEAMAWRQMATNYYRNQHWLISITPHGITALKWVDRMCSLNSITLSVTYLSNESIDLFSCLCLRQWPVT